MNETCPLCHGTTVFFYRGKLANFFTCNTCKGIFMEREKLPAKDAEYIRYNKHQNDINDKGYVSFISPIVNAVLERCRPDEKGLDFGSGPVAVLTELLRNKGFNILPYDPFFSNKPVLLQERYDYIVCCEVIEHFHHPGREFGLLKKMLLPGGKMFLMTSVYSETIDFGTWYYKNDFTHVFFYSAATFEYIRKSFGFSKMEITGNMVVFVS